jgi:hypothetical protein
MVVVAAGLMSEVVCGTPVSEPCSSGMESPGTTVSTGGGTVAETDATPPITNTNVPIAHAKNSLRISDQ